MKKRERIVCVGYTPIKKSYIILSDESLSMNLRVTPLMENII